MATVFNDILVSPNQTLLRPSLHSPTSFFTSPTRKFPCFRPNPIIRCSIAEGSTASPPKTRDSAPVDCVVVGGGISGLCIAQALSTKHAKSNVFVTEARDRVGGNITTLERDGYLWEEGPNSFQPSDPMLTMVVCNVSFPQFGIVASSIECMFAFPLVS